MRTAVIAGALGTLLWGGAVAGAAEPKPSAACLLRSDPQGWEILFDGEDLAAWDAAEHPGVWQINEHGEVYPAKPGAYLNTKRRYCDFELEVEFKMGASTRPIAAFFCGCTT